MIDNIEYKYKLKEDILNWIAEGRGVGLSAQAMALSVTGNFKQKNHPYDPSDFNRCLKLIKKIPEIEDNFDEVAKISGTWSKLIEHWSDIESCFLNEVGFDWCNGNRAPATYELIKSIID